MELGLIESQAKMEALRCLKCDLSINVGANEVYSVAGAVWFAL
jgi:formate dehydrogenase beta subunit